MHGYLLRQFNPICVLLTKNIPNGLKDKEEIELLLHLIDLNVIVETFKDPLRIAVRCGDLRWVKLLLKNGAQLRGSIFNQARDYAKSIIPIFGEANLSAVKVLRLVLKYDTNINKTELLTTLTYENGVLASKVLVEMARLLIQAGALNVNGEVSGETLLIDATVHEKYDLALFLIEKGADLGYLIYPSGLAEGGTVLHNACEFGKLDYIILLIDKGADITMTDCQGKTPFATFMSSYEHYNRDYFEYQDFFNKLNRVKTCFIKEIARAKFESQKVIPSDLDIIRSKPFLTQIFRECNNQLNELKNTMFYPPYSLIDVLGMRNKNIQRLAKLLKNNDFALNLESNLSFKESHDLYYKDLNIILKEAKIVKIKYNEFELSLISVMGKYIPVDVINLIVDFLRLFRFIFVPLNMTSK